MEHTYETHGAAERARLVAVLQDAERESARCQNISQGPGCYCFQAVLDAADRLERWNVAMLESL